MAATPYVKYDDGAIPDGFAANCFPVRTLLRNGEDVNGAWLVAQRAEQRRRFKAVLCTKPRTYSRIKGERKRAEKQGTALASQSFINDEDEDEEEAPLLDGFFLMKYCCVEDPVDLCSVNIAGKELTEYKEEDFQLFDNVAYVNAAENYLPFEAFRGFPIIRELEVPLNAIRNIRLNPGDYPLLEMVDMSYNNISHDDVLALGTLPALKVLHLTGNNFRSLPTDMAIPYLDPNSKRQVPRFKNLEILMLDDNRLTDVRVFAALAGLNRLRHLNLEKNEIFYVPQLKSVEGTMVVNEDEKATEKLRKSARKSGRKSARTPRSGKQTEREPEVSVVVDKPEGEKTEMSKMDTTLASESILAPANTLDIRSDVKSMDDPASKKPETSNVTELLETEFSGTMGDLSARIKDLDFTVSSPHIIDTARNGAQNSFRDEKAPSFPPFPELRYLNLARNTITEEEALLAVAAWPMLMELIIHSNPLTTMKSGDPPLLSRFLQDRLGIKLIRKKQNDNSFIKPKVEITQKKSRKVTTIVPKIPKIPLEERLMLEAPKPPPGPKPDHTRPGHSQVVNALDLHNKPLSPIPGTPDYQRPFSAGSEPKSQGGKEGVNETKNAWEDESHPVIEEDEVKEDERGGSAFFMTQVDEQEGDTTQKDQPKKEKKEKKHRRKHKDKTKEKSDTRYKGYELLLDCEDDPDFIEPNDMQGNVRALKYALNHELVYRDPAVHLHKVTRHIEPYKKWTLPELTPRRTKQEVIGETLDFIRKRPTVEESNLGEVLTSRRKPPSDLADAQKLLGEIQRRYNSVRVNSMKEAKEARTLISGLKEVHGPKKDAHVTIS
ncbi:X-ray radiation resistance-associated protein 1-like [Mizuhopecten yessoensis]|uniref:X-ray radiation resistance-associated protein 1-like n=1 Tax=Mizuhopecten yessoensis TaxID=6573 RepID=UPI000B458B4F|nr:X-ray radiation resistance-associated protein 1-like [Mizuhopecten yessoensis]